MKRHVKAVQAFAVTAQEDLSSQVDAHSCHLAQLSVDFVAQEKDLAHFIQHHHLPLVDLLFRQYPVSLCQCYQKIDSDVGSPSPSLSSYCPPPNTASPSPLPIPNRPRLHPFTPPQLIRHPLFRRASVYPSLTQDGSRGSPPITSPLSSVHSRSVLIHEADGPLVSSSSSSSEVPPLLEEQTSEDEDFEDAEGGGSEVWERFGSGGVRIGGV